MTYHLLSPTKKHIIQIAAIWEAGWHDAHSEIVPSSLRELRTTKSFVERVQTHLSNTRIACADDKVLGFHMVSGDELYQMYVSSDARGSGTAHALIKDAENRIHADGHQSAWLACAVGNTRAIRFYEKTGWVNQGRVVVDLETSEGAFPMEVWRFEKRLKAPHLD